MWQKFSITWKITDDHNQLRPKDINNRTYLICKKITRVVWKLIKHYSKAVLSTRCHLVAELRLVACNRFFIVCSNSKSLSNDISPLNCDIMLKLAVSCMRHQHNDYKRPGISPLQPQVPTPGLSHTSPTDTYVISQGLSQPFLPGVLDLPHGPGRFYSFPGSSPAGKDSQSIHSNRVTPESNNLTFDCTAQSR